MQSQSIGVLGFECPGIVAIAQVYPKYCYGAKGI